MNSTTLNANELMDAKHFIDSIHDNIVEFVISRLEDDHDIDESPENTRNEIKLYLNKIIMDNLFEDNFNQYNTHPIVILVNNRLASTYIHPDMLDNDPNNNIYRFIQIMYFHLYTKKLNKIINNVVEYLDQ
jgi:hypothetical protein